MKGHFYRRDCKCKKKRCTCGAKKRKQKSKSGFKTKKEAVAAAAALIHELEHGTYIEETDRTFGNFAREWLPIYSEEKDVKPGTIRVRLHEISRLQPYFGQLKLKDITPKMYQEALNDLKDLGYADSTNEAVGQFGRCLYEEW